MNSVLPVCSTVHSQLKLLKNYIESGQLLRAHKLFDTIPHPNIRIWTALITGYTSKGLPKESIKLYNEFIKAGDLNPDKYVLLTVAKACGIVSDLNKAKQVHADAVKHDIHSDIILGNALIHMYGKCGFPQGAMTVFDSLVLKDVISWTSVIAAHVNSGLSHKALQLFREMTLYGLRPNSVTLSSLLPACSYLKALNTGKVIHGYAIRNGLVDNLFVSSALVDTYAKCLSIMYARNVFHKLPRKDTISWNVILAALFSNGHQEEALDLFETMKLEGANLDSATWNSMIGGCAQNGKSQLALRFLLQMQCSGFKANNMTIASILPACTDLENLSGGREIHAYCFRHSLNRDVFIATALVLMYAKCGELDLSRKIFNMIPRKDIVSWNTMILANAMHGCGQEALLLFQVMINFGYKPNAVTFTAILSGCSHSQLVDEGRAIFISIKRDHGIEPDVDHYSCMVDVLCRAGHLYDAYDFIKKMPIDPSPSAWGSLLAGCRVYKNVELGKISAYKLFEIEPNNPGNYVLLSNILVTAKLWNDASEVRKMMRDGGIVKEPGCSWIPIGKQVYTFVKGDRRIPQCEKIYAFLKETRKKMRLQGYLPKTDFVLQDIDDEEKEEVLCDHSEKLAVAFGILNSNGKPSIRVFKNLRICGDCHNWIKFMAKATLMQITVRDSLRFHHFKDGICSCGDVW